MKKSMNQGLLICMCLMVFMACNKEAKKVVPEVSKVKIEEFGQSQENKKLVKDFVEAMRNSEVEKLSTMIHPDFSWWIIGKPEYLATAGEHDSDYFLGFFKGTELFPEGADFKTTSMISEGKVVAAEAEFKAKTAMGSYYENYYHFLFVIEDGKIKRMKEYMDTYHAKETFGL